MSLGMGILIALGIFVAFLVLYTVGLLVFAIPCHCEGWRDGQDDMKRQAIEAGVAEYRISPKTGSVEFTWITNSKDTP